MKVADLEGPWLEYWVARAEGIPADRLAVIEVPGGKICVTGSTPLDPSSPRRTLNFSTDWDQGGGILARGRITVRELPESAGYNASFSNTYVWFEGRNPLIAAMRAHVFKAFGAEVEEVTI